MRLLILSRAEAEKTLTWIPDLKGLVSLHSPPASRLAAFEPEKTQACAGFDAFTGPKIALGFDDAIRTKDPDVFPMSEAQMSELLEWGAKVDFSGEGSFIVHCSAGVARSSASMLALLTQWGGQGSESESLERCFQASKFIWPNDLIVELADAALKRHGDLIVAVQDWKKKMKERVVV